jgi:hypothetical protein
VAGSDLEVVMLWLNALFARQAQPAAAQPHVAGSSAGRQSHVGGHAGVSYEPALLQVLHSIRAELPPSSRVLVW